MIHVYAEVEKGYTLRVELGDGSSFDLKAAGNGVSACHWLLEKPVEFGMGGFVYKLVLVPPASGSIFGALRDTFTGSNQTRKTKEFQVTGPPGRLNHAFNSGFQGDTPLEERLAITLKSLIITFSSTRIVDSAITDLLSLSTSGRIDYTRTIMSILRPQTLSPALLLLCVRVLSSNPASVTYETRALLATALTRLDPPAGGLNADQKGQLASVLRNPSSFEVAWIAAIRWGVVELPRKPTPAGGADSEYTEALLVFSANKPRMAVQELSKVLCALLAQAPAVETLAVLLPIEWPYSHRPHAHAQALSHQATIAGIIDGLMIPYPVTRELAAALRDTWSRMVAPLKLSALLKQHRDFGAVPDAADAIRRQACNVAGWDLGGDATVAGLRELGLGDSQELSTQVLINLCATGLSGAHFLLFPRLLVVLRTSKESRAKNALAWVHAIVLNSSHVKGEAICNLYLAVQQTWSAWSSAPDDASVALFKELRTVLHRRPDCGGANALLDAARRLGDGPTLTTDLRSEVFNVAIENVLVQKCGGHALQIGERAMEVLRLLAPQQTRDGRHEVPHSLSESVLTVLLGMLSRHMPQASDRELLHSLIDADRAVFWTRMLVVAGVNGQLLQHPLFMRVRRALLNLSASIRTRMIHVDAVDELLLHSARINGHRTVSDYGNAVGHAHVQPPACNQLMDDVRQLRATHDALEHFNEHRVSIDRVVDRDAFAGDVHRVRQLDGVPLGTAEAEEHWGAILTPDVRQAAETAFRLRGSKLFGDEWQRALTSAAEQLHVAELVQVCRNASQAFRAKSEQMLSNEQLMVSEVAQIFEGPQSREAVETLLRMLPNELELMFPGQSSSFGVVQLKGKLEWFAKTVLTLQDAAALLGLASNLGVATPSEGSRLGTLAEELIGIGEDLDQPLTTLADDSARFYQMMRPYEQQLAAANHLGAKQPVVVELLRFLRDEVGDNDPRDLADNEEDQAGLGEAITALIKVHTVLKPLLKEQPGTLDDALTRLGDRLLVTRVHGDELSSQLELCTSNLHALRRTYNKMMNKGKESKETIKDIVEHGVFVFGSGPLMVEFEGEQRSTPIDEATLRDYRSRALLEMNSKRSVAESPEEQEKRAIEKGEREAFLEMTIIAVSISESISELYELGYFRPEVLERHVSGVDALKGFDSMLRKERDDWRKAISTAREQTYELSFFCSQQLLQLHKFFNGDSTEGRHLLHYVPTREKPALSKGLSEGLSPQSPATSASVPSPHTQPAHSRPKPATQLGELGAMLQAHFEGAQPESVKPSAWRKRQPAQLVAEGELALCFVEPSVGRSNMLETLLALYSADCVLPAHAQLLFCRADTTHEEIDAFLHRAFHANKSALVAGRLFCALRISVLPEASYLYFKQQMMLFYHTTHPRLVRLALLCEAADQQRVSTDLANFVKTVRPLNEDQMRAAFAELKHVVVVSSACAGLGKTEHVKSLAKEHGCRTLRTVAVSGFTSREELVGTLLRLLSRDSGDALHLNILDVPASCKEVVNDMMLELLCLSMVGSSAASSESLVHVPYKTIFVELANTVGSDLRNDLPICRYFEQARLQPLSLELGIDARSVTRPRLLEQLTLVSADDVQIVCAYLQALGQGSIDAADPPIGEPLDNARCWALLNQNFLQLPSVQAAPSYAQLQVFVNVLAQQLRAFQKGCEGFFAVWLLREGGHNAVRGVILRSLVDTAARLATRAVGNGGGAAAQEGDAAQIAQRLHVQSFEETRYVLLLMQADGGLTPFPDPATLFQGAAPVDRYYRDPIHGSVQPPNYRALNQQQLFEQLLLFLAVNDPALVQKLRVSDERRRYTLTADNLLKMMLVSVRLRGRVPVIISGETGCGKTSLVKFLAYMVGLIDDKNEQNFCVLNMHAGIGKQQIAEFVTESEKVARESRKEVWCFFDEVNTSHHIGLVSEVVCRRVLNGKHVHGQLRFIAAVNPHKRRTKEVERVGLQSKLNTEDPMRQLVYRVHPLPEAMLDYVWDYGRLHENDERSYIENMLSSGLLPQLAARLVHASQQFIRRKEEDCSVSLRDVRRFQRLVPWFYETRRRRAATDASVARPASSSYFSRLYRPDYMRDRTAEEQAVLLSLAHCYYVRLASSESRAEYRRLLRQTWNAHDAAALRSGPELRVDEFVDVIKAEQHEYLRRMHIPDGVALNGALLENVFVLLVCILNRLPVFLVGKPGCSKSLAMQLIFANLRGRDSTDHHFKTLPQLLEFRYQCSEDSTSEGIRKVFERVKKAAAKDEEAIAVLLLDEIGLAEVSRHNPLKVLHELIEPDSRAELAALGGGREVSPHDLPYAVVGISNWALDAAKMNRAVVLSRPEPDVDELTQTATAIVESLSSAGRAKDKGKLLCAVSSAYFEFRKRQQGSSDAAQGQTSADDAGARERDEAAANFHGLRDFYNLVRSIGRSINLDDAAVAEAVARNFGGLPRSAAQFLQILDDNLKTKRSHLRTLPTATELITANLQDARARHLMLIVRGDAATCLLELPQIRAQLNDPVVMLASRFREDQGEEHACSQLSRIISEMEAGRQLIVKDFDRIYGALYDMLNQNYRERTVQTAAGEQRRRFCRVAHGNTAKHCDVHEAFRMVILEEERDLQHSDPPRLNRCEKQQLTYLSVLAEQPGGIGDKLLVELKTFCTALASCNTGGGLTERDAFLGFTEDTLPSLLVREIQAEHGAPDAASVRMRCKQTLLDLMPADAVARTELSTFAQEADNMDELDRLVKAYYSQAHHAGLAECLMHYAPRLVHRRDGRAAMAVESVVSEQQQHERLLVLTFTSWQSSVETILEERGVGTKNLRMLHLVDVQSEARLRDAFAAFWDPAEPRDVLVLQCDAALHAQHLLLTRELMRESERAYYAGGHERRRKMQVIVLHVSRFQRDAEGTAGAERWEFSCLSGWKQVVVDRLEGSASDFEMLQAAREVHGAASLVMGSYGEKRVAGASLRDVIKEQLPWAIRRLGYPHRQPRETLDHVNAVVAEMMSNLAVLDRIEMLLSAELTKGIATSVAAGRWLQQLACDQGALVRASSLCSLVLEKVVEAVRQPLALLLWRIEKSSALTGLVAIARSEAQLRLWLNVFMPEDSSLPKPPADCFWSTESLRLDAHETVLEWPYSPEVLRLFEGRRSDFTELGTSAARIQTVKEGLCEQFVTDSELLLRLALLHDGGAADALSGLHFGSSGNETPMAIDAAAGEHVSHGRDLDETWNHNRDRFKNDVVSMLAAGLSRLTGVPAKIIKPLVARALAPSYVLDPGYEWHPADVVLARWDVEPTLQHVLQLYLIAKSSDEMDIEEEEEETEGSLAADLAERAVLRCLSTSAKPIDRWLSRAQRCLNHADALNSIGDAERGVEDVDLGSAKVQLQKLRVCADFAARIVFIHNVGHETLEQLAAAATHPAPHNIDQILQRTDASSLDDEARTAVAVALVQFRALFLTRQLKEAPDGAVLASVSDLLREQTRAAEGDVSPVVGSVVNAALTALDLTGPAAEYNQHRASADCFRGVQTLIEDSLGDVASDTPAQLVCATLQVHHIGVIEAARALCQGEPQSKRARHDPASSMAGTSAGPALSPKLVLLCESFADATAQAAEYLQATRAAGLYHLSFVKAFICVLCKHLGREPTDADALMQQRAEAVLGAAPEAYRKALLHFALKLLHGPPRSYSMNQLMHDCKHGAIGRQLPCLRALVGDTTVLSAESKLGFDPFVMYGEEYTAARNALQLAHDPQAADLEVIEPRFALFSAASTIYLPRARAGVDDAEARRAIPPACTALGRIVQPSSPLGVLAHCLASNEFKHLPARISAGFELGGAADPKAVSLAVHLAGVLDTASAGPLATYAHRPANCTRTFVLVAPSDEFASALQGITDVTKFYQCQCGYRYAVGDCGHVVGTGRCLSCGQPIGGVGGYGVGPAGGAELGGIQANDEPGYLRAPQEVGRDHRHSLRGLTPVGFRALHLLVHLSLFAGKLLGHDGRGLLTLLRPVAQTEEQAATYMWDIVLNDLQMLSQLVSDCTPEQICAWLHDIIQRLPTMPHAETNLASSAERRRWEDSFQATFIAHANADTIRACAAARPSGTELRPLLHRIVAEEVEEEGPVPKLLTPVATPSLDALRTAFTGSASERRSHAFLELVLIGPQEWNGLELLLLVELLWPLVAWDMAMRKHWGRQITQEEACNRTIGELLETCERRDADEVSRIFDQFAAAWNELVELIAKGGLAKQRYQAAADPFHACREAKPPSAMDRDCKVSMCCIDTKGEINESNMLLRFLVMLGRAQNDLLAETTRLVSDNASLQAINAGGGMVDLGKHTPLLQLAREHVLLDRDDSLESLTESMLDFSCCGAAGRRVAYDFAGMEASAASRLLLGTTLIDFEGEGARHLVPFPFGGELQQLRRGSYVGLQAVEKAIAQQPLPNMDGLRAEPFLQETHQARALLELLELVLHDVTKSRPAADETLAKFCRSFGHGQQRGSLPRRALECAAIGNVLLLHVRSLYELVEGMVADAVLAGAAVRERTVPERFSEPLPSVSAIASAACLAFGQLHPEVSREADDGVKMKAGLLWFEPALKRFIYRELQESSTIDAAHGLCRYVDSFPWQGGDDVDFEDAAMQELPEEQVRVEHALALWVELRKRLG